MVQKIKAYLRNETVKDSLILYIGQSLHLVFAFFVSMVRPDLLGPTQAGMIAYVNSFINTSATFFSFGFDASGKRLITLAEKEEKHKYVGATMLVGFLLSAIYSMFVLLLSLFLRLKGDTTSSFLMLVIVPFSSYSILSLFSRSCAYSTGEVRRAAWITCGYSVLYLPLIYLLNSLHIYNARVAIFSEYALCMGVVLASLAGWYKFLKIDKAVMRELRQENRVFGRKTYLGRIISMPTFNLDSVILGWTHPMDSVGFYSLANSITRPIMAVGDSVGSGYFRKFKNSPTIPRKLHLMTDLVMGVIALAAWASGTLIIRFYLGERFYETLPILPWIAAVMFIRGATSIYNNFLSAKGYGRELRLCGIVFGISNLVTNFTLIPLFGAMGCVVASAISLLINYTVHLFTYLKAINKK